jgi:hypothetical protein
MKESIQIAAAIFSTISLTLAVPAIAQSPEEVCDQVWPDEPFLASNNSRTVQIDTVGIQIDIPENYRTLVRATGTASVLPPSGYDYAQCMITNQVPASLDVIDVFFYKDAPVSEALLRNQLSSDRNSRHGIKRILGETTVAGQQAFIYVEASTDTNLVVHFNYPDQSASLAISTYINEDGEVILQEQLTQVLSSLSFL